VDEPLNEAREAQVQVFLEKIESRRRRLSDSLSSDQRASLGQFFTPVPAANLIAGMIALPAAGTIRVLDPGAGFGSLSAALVARVVRERSNLTVSISAIEVDPFLTSHLRETLEECQRLASIAGLELTFQLKTGDVVEIATGWQRELFEQFDIVIMNPPYRKLGARSLQRRLLAHLGVDSPNLYTTFLAIGALSLVPGGQLVAITPRSFANGPYFSDFRKFLLSQVVLEHIHVFESRSTVFADTGVLQENIVFSARRWGTAGPVTLSVSHGHEDSMSSRAVQYEEIVRSDDSHRFIRIPAQTEDSTVVGEMASLPCALSDLGVQVSTGKVVDFRAREHLLETASHHSVPLIYPGNLKHGRVHWPSRITKPQALARNAATKKLLLPSERYLLVKRFSAKEERRRVVAGVCDTKEIAPDGIAFENHLNVFHTGGHGLDEALAAGLCLWLNSSVVDRYFRTFSGHTQVNATDLRAMRYPSLGQLIAMATEADGDLPDQDVIDTMVRKHVLGMQRES
jgi:adenine-specific DNA-methyltransferase